ncbi:MAG: TrkA family potassium uptake protein [Clostridiales bacterium]|nr:TrkA family potassium uptake protein [Clostridiales bacterium]
MRKSILIIGIGRLGSHLAEKMQDLGHDVMLLDRKKETISKMASRFSDVRVADYTDEGVLKSFDIPSFDLCFVTVGDDLEATMVSTVLLKKLGAKYVASRARDEVQCELLKKIGADEVIYADGETADKLAARHNGHNIFDYVELTGGYAIFEIPILKTWVGKTILELDVRRRFKINIVAIKNGSILNPSPMPDYTFAANDHILVIGKSKEVFKLAEKS